ncbi:MAG: transcription antitermination factor NusB [Legionellales bacterium]|jgi:transcription antitermination protein NusB|nr:transcription antitermination factor NusB [Legionellales bacterium]
MARAETRYNSRELLLKLIFQWEYGNSLSMYEVSEFGGSGESYDKDYYKEIANDIFSKINDLDEIIIGFLDRDISAMSKVELAVLRLASYEILYRDDVPFKVCIDQAARLNKKFGTEQGHKYINAVLDSIVQQHRKIEYLAAKGKKK